MRGKKFQRLQGKEKHGGGGKESENRGCLLEKKNWVLRERVGIKGGDKVWRKGRGGGSEGSAGRIPGKEAQDEEGVNRIRFGEKAQQRSVLGQKA